MSKEINGVKISSVRVQPEGSDVSVKVYLGEDSPTARECGWPASWSERDMTCDEFGFGETIDEEELNRRRADARAKAARSVAKAFYAEEE